MCHSQEWMSVGRGLEYKRNRRLETQGKSRRIGALLCLAALFLCLGCSRRSTQDDARVLEYAKEPRLFVICYPPNVAGWDYVREHGVFIRLKDALPREKYVGQPIVSPSHVLCGDDGQEMLRFALIRMEGEGDERGLYRLLYSVGQVRNSKDFRYDGEDWLPVASGERWLAAVVRNWKQ